MTIPLSVAISPSETPDRLVTIAKRVEGFGYERFMVSDAPARDVFPFLALCAANTKNIILGTSVTNAVTRHPMVTASAAAVMDEVSGGRMVLGLGAGGTFIDNLGLVEKSVASRRLTALKEAILIIRALLRGESVTFTGKIFKLKNARLSFAGTPPNIPILVTSISPGIQALAGELADFAMVGSTRVAFENYQEHLRNVKAGIARRIDRKSPQLVAYLSVCCTRDDALAKKGAKLFAAKHFLDFVAEGKHEPQEFGLSSEEGQRILTGFKKLPGAYAYQYGIPAEMDEAVKDNVVEEFCVAGSPEQCVKRVKGVLAAGFDSCQLYPIPALGFKERHFGYLETLESFSSAWS